MPRLIARYYSTRSGWLLIAVGIFLLVCSVVPYMAAAPYRSAVKDSPTTTGLRVDGARIGKPPVATTFIPDPAAGPGAAP